MKVVAFLPAKGSSDRVKNKNLRLLDGKPLFLHTLEKLVNSRIFDEVYLDTESEDIIDLAKHIDCKVMRRDPNLATNKTDGHQLFLNQVNHTDADIVVQVLCTSPFISIETLKTAVDVLKHKDDYDSVVLVRREKMYLWQDEQPSYNLKHIPNSVDLPDTVIETMGLYAMRSSVALELKRRIGNKPYLINATPLEAIDVNWPEDADLADLIAAGVRERERKLLANLGRLVNSALLSDILDDLGLHHQIIRGLNLNLDQDKVMGRAKTLKLRRLKQGEDFKGIYDALQSYSTIVPGDIIMVENEVSEYAYFGELNANLAIRAGAVGAVIGGITRDSADVKRLSLPVFAKGYSCQDVRKRATVESMNQPIHIEGVDIAAGDLIFGDKEGVVVIPKQYEHQVLNIALQHASNEKKLLVDIAQGINVNELTLKYGFF
ncbi:RraA family protein [Acinetobacter higginsii]|uniref:RraA family protein n=1 Tax=Acinetobacter higginsii TaxID=70347 RepID=UPI001F4BC98B|nr:NTP transferase domain-containing protein [Acinetobacter higginsii]MCH7339010.1 hypothetical protein [Acinetobacter higginsii]